MYDDSKEAWTIPSLKTPGQLSVRNRRPYTNCHHDHDSDSFVDLDIEMPIRTTPDPENPNTPQIISSILAMDLNDDMEEIPRRDKKRQDKLFRINDVSNISSIILFVHDLNHQIAY